MANLLSHSRERKKYEIRVEQVASGFVSDVLSSAAAVVPRGRLNWCKEKYLGETIDEPGEDSNLQSVD